LTLGGVVLTVNGDGAVVERQLAGGELGCPLCGGALGGWGHARPRPVRMAEGPDVVLAPRRSRCPGCGATHVLLPAWCLSRRADEGAVIGSALQAAAAGAGHRTIAARLGRPASTVRGWLRRFAARAEDVRAFFTVLLARTSPDPVMPAGAGRPGGGRGVGDRGRRGSGGAALAPARHGAGVGGGVGGQRRAADRAGLAGRGPLHELTRYPLPGRREMVCRSLTPMTGGGARMGMSKAEEEEQARLERARAIGLFRYMLIREAADPALSSRQRGKMVRAIAAREHADPSGRPVRLTRWTLDRWIRLWQQGGFDALVSVPRQCQPRTPPEVMELAAALKKENPARTAAQVQRILKAQSGWAPDETTIQRMFRRDRADRADPGRGRARVRAVGGVAAQ